MEEEEMTIGDYLDEKFPKNGSKDPKKKDTEDTGISSEDFNSFLDEKFKTE